MNFFAFSLDRDRSIYNYGDEEIAYITLAGTVVWEHMDAKHESDGELIGAFAEDLKAALDYVRDGRFEGQA